MNSIIRTMTMLKAAKDKVLPLIILSLIINACTLINPTITKTKYEQVQIGMTLSQVQKIMGKSGEATGEISFNIPGVTSSPIGSQQAFYQWKNSDGSSATAIFVNDKLVFKTELNLK